MKPREVRRSVMIKARMRGPAGWQDACILNLSQRGLLVQSSSPAPCGAYVEIRRGPHVVVGRVVWAYDRRFGVRAQDVLPVAALLTDGPASPVAAASPLPPAERRAAPRAPDRHHEQSRLRARATEFIGLVFVGALAATFAYSAVADALARPLAEAGRAMDGASDR